ncbi:hypothetical protein [Deinococcus sp.]|uniref:hypothetical protein n=1 Tax=Deinococcus sp. TaxID=47478 RepID=UPI003B5C4D94
MGEGKPSSTPSTSASEAREMDALKDQTVPAKDDQAYWQQTSDDGPQVKSEDTPETDAEVPAPGSIPTGTETFGSLKDGMLPSGATTDPEGKAKKPE